MLRCLNHANNAKLFINLLSEFLELSHALAQIIVLEVRTRVWTGVLAVRVVIEVNALEVLEIYVVYIGIYGCWSGNCLLLSTWVVTVVILFILTVICIFFIHVLSHSIS